MQADCKLAWGYTWVLAVELRQQVYLNNQTQAYRLTDFRKYSSITDFSRNTVRREGSTRNLAGSRSCLKGNWALSSGPFMSALKNNLSPQMGKKMTTRSCQWMKIGCNLKKTRLRKLWLKSLDPKSWSLSQRTNLSTFRCFKTNFRSLRAKTSLRFATTARRLFRKPRQLFKRASKLQRRHWALRLPQLRWCCLTSRCLAWTESNWSLNWKPSSVVWMEDSAMCL